MHRKFRLLWGALALALCAAAAEPPAEWKAALDRISAQSLLGHLSFLASDALEGRETPSRGLDVAAEYIAAQFRRAGLEPAGDDGFFQTAKMVEVAPDTEGFQLTLRRGEDVLTVPPADVLLRAPKAVDLAGVGVLRAGRGAALDAGQVKGRIVVVDSLPAYFAARKLNPAAIVRLEEERRPESSLPHLVEADAVVAGCPVITVFGAGAGGKWRDLKLGAGDWKASLRVQASRTTPVTVRNVIGLLRGSDPVLRDSYVLLTAHYDHLGLAQSGKDRVFNGANDDGSGTVSVIEIGAALAALPRHPRRSILFMTFFGEEEGLLGSRYYARHPVFPLQQTIADINLEQLGRTDATEGPEVGNATLTGFEYSEVPAVFQKAGGMTGIKVYEAPNGDNEFFNRSDNFSFAEHGIPAHTVVVAADYPDYHAVGDEWRKIDYGNMARVDRMLALGVLLLADNPQAPKWNADKARRYAKKNTDTDEHR